MEKIDAIMIKDRVYAVAIKGVGDGVHFGPVKPSGPYFRTGAVSYVQKNMHLL